MKRKIVIVKWVDSVHTGGWGEKPASTMVCFTVSLLVEKTKEYILIAQSASAYCDAHYIQIPMVSVDTVRAVATMEQPKK